MYFIKQKYNPVLVAVQCWDEFDSHIDYIWRYDNEINGKIIYGGFDENGIPIGGTGIYLSEEFREIITAVIDIDSRGRIGPQEIDFARSKGLKIIHIPALPKNV